MSTQWAIAGVTRTLQSLLQSDAGINVTTKTPDQAAKDAGRRVNLFLYHTMHNASWRNLDIPGKNRKSERGVPPLALNLHYLLTAYGEDGANLADQELLGQAMLTLHDYPILKKNRIEDALKNYANLAKSELANQIDKVRIVPEYLDIENMYRLWTTFQTQYRVSAAYQVSVVLIESRRPGPSALPVARRGEDDQGVISDVGAPALLTGLENRANSNEPRMPSATVGSVITLLGENLPSDAIAVVRDPLLDARDSDSDVIARLPLREISMQSAVVELDPNLGTWRVGMLTIELEIPRDGKTRNTNAIPLAIAPHILTSGGATSVVATQTPRNDKKILEIALAEPVSKSSQVMLTLNAYDPSSNRNTAKGPWQLPSEPTTLGNRFSPSFDVARVPDGEYWVRLRVDGVESLMMAKRFDPESGRYALEFDEQQRVILR